MEIDWQYYHWHLEPSAICSLRCPRCPRTEYPDTPWLNHTMSLNFFKSFMSEEMLKTKVKRFTMCGDVGDPIYCKDYLEIYRYIKNTNPDIHIFTITNGSGKSTKWWEEFASIANEKDSINFSIDGYDDQSNNMYRINSQWQSIINGISTLRNNNDKIFMNWALIVFKFNENQLGKIKDMALHYGFDGFQLTKSTKFGCKYGNAYGGEDDHLEPSSKWISSTDRYERIVKNLSGRIQDNQNYIDNNQKRYEIVSTKYKNKPIIPLCEIGNRGIYVNAEGVVFPCSWVSFPYKSLNYGNKTIFWEDSFFSKYRKQMNLNNRSLKDILSDPLWNLCSRGWIDPSKTWVECSQKCNNKVVDKDYAVGWETN